MSNINICVNCGSSEIVSDRSLGGRMVCSKCGSSSFKKSSFYPWNKKNFIYIVIGLFVLLIIII